MNRYNGSSTAQGTRASGRVKGTFGMPTFHVSSQQKDQSNDVLMIYRKLVSLRDHDESELSKAISYNLKLLGKLGGESGHRSNS